MNIVVIASELYGDSFAIARHVHMVGMLVEMAYRPPIGTCLTVHFQHVRDCGACDEIVVRTVVHSYQTIDDVLVCLSFVEFVDSASDIPADRVQ